MRLTCCVEFVGVCGCVVLNEAGVWCICPRDVWVVVFIYDLMLVGVSPGKVRRKFCLEEWSRVEMQGEKNMR